MKFCNSCDGAYNSVDIRFCKSCDNNCSFCIEKNGLKSFGKPNVQELIKSTLETGINDVLILGGEPFLYPKELLEYVKGIRKHVDTIYITTSLPNKFCNFRLDSTIDCILRLIDGLNISIQSSNWIENNNLFNASSNHNRLEILRILNIYYAGKIRTSINLVKGGIDTKEKLLTTLHNLEEIGCIDIKINELQHQEDLYVSYEKIMDIKMKSPYAHGCNTKIKISDIKANILLKRSCFVVENSLNASILDGIKAIIKRFFYRKQNKFAVIYENGKIEKGWLKCLQK